MDMRFIFVCAGLLCVAPAYSLAARNAEAQSAVFFEDEFDGPQIDPLKWRTEDVVTGMRWCDPNAGLQAGPGSWVNPATETCYGVGEPLPHGTAVLDAGVLMLGASVQGRTFPYLASRLPQGTSPFPAVGDFSFVVRMRYDHGGAWGDGVVVLKWNDTTPSGDNAPSPFGSLVLGVWADPGIRLGTEVRGVPEQIPVSVQDPGAFHDYETRYEGGAYSFFVDGVLVFGPVTSTLRPSAIWIGNPVLSYWGPGGWSTITVDHVRVEATGVTSAHQATWGGLKVRYR